MRYGDIHEKFEEIFAWIKEHYPSGGFFIVEKNCAKCYEGNPTLEIFSKEIKETCDKFSKLLKNLKDEKSPY